MLLERGASAGVQHIRLQEVLRSVGLTTGAAYRIWADQTDFHRDLAVAMVGLRLAPPAASVSRAASIVLDAHGTLDDFIRAGTLDHVSNAQRFHLEPDTRMSHAFLTALSLRTAAGAWPELREASVARHEESIDDYSRFYALAMEAFGLRMRTPFTLRDFANALAALGEGFAVRAASGLDHPAIDVSAEDEGPEGSWTLLGLTVRGLVDTFMVRIGDAAEPGSEAAPAP